MTVVIAEGFGADAGGLRWGAGGLGGAVDGRGGAAGELTDRGVEDSFGGAATAPLVGFGGGASVGFGRLADAAATVVDLGLGIGGLPDVLTSLDGVARTTGVVSDASPVAPGPARTEGLGTRLPTSTT
jgi:hypothetical protein